MPTILICGGNKPLVLNSVSVIWKIKKSSSGSYHQKKQYRAEKSVLYLSQVSDSWEVTKVSMGHLLSSYSKRHLLSQVTSPMYDNDTAVRDVPLTVLSSSYKNNTTDAF